MLSQPSPLDHETASSHRPPVKPSWPVRAREKNLQVPTSGQAIKLSQGSRRSPTSDDVDLNLVASPSEPLNDCRLQSQEQVDSDLRTGELDIKFRGLSLTPARSVVNEKQKNKRTSEAALTPTDEPCLNCRPTRRRRARECVDGGFNGTCRPCQSRKLKCSKYSEYLLQWC